MLSQSLSRRSVVELNNSRTAFEAPTIEGASEFENKYGSILAKYNLNFTFLVTPETSDERLQYLDGLSSGFLYAVSSSSTTGNQNATLYNDEYLDRLAASNLKNPVYIGFGIKDKDGFQYVTQKAEGGIIGTAFVNLLLKDKDWEITGKNFIRSIIN